LVSGRQIAESIKDSNCDGWLVYDYRGLNPILSQLLGRSLFLTRRAFLFFTGEDLPRMLISRVDYTEAMKDLDGIEIDRYTTWQDLDGWLAKHLGPLEVVAMEYSPSGELPAMSRVDGGTLDLVRAQGVEVVSSAALFQATAAAWTEENLRSHERAMDHVVAIKDAAFELVASRLRAGEPCDESSIQAFIVAEFAARDLVTDEPPIVSVNAHSGDPHYAPTAQVGAEINKGDWLLIDLWARERGPHGIFADITWVGHLGPVVPSKPMEVFDVVARARDAVIAHVQANEGVRGFELDRVARDLITAAGYGEYFVHRTGHSLSSGEAVHGLGANLDDFETHDTRPLAPGLGFTIEPGVYLPEFGVRSEVNVYMAPAGATVTAPLQAAPLTFDL
jgi:Xaa-Pro aminopeptidase